MIARTELSIAVLVLGYVFFNLIAGYRPWFQAKAAGAMLVVGLGAAVSMAMIPAPLLRALSVGFLFLAVATFAKVKWDAYPEDASESPTDASEASDDTTLLPNIIDFTWFSVMAAAVTGVVFAQSVPPLSEPLPEAGLPVEYYSAYLENARFLFGRVVTGVVALASVLAAAMGILWANDVWRDGSDRSYVYTTRRALKMVVAFFAVVTILVIAVLHPLYVRITAVPELIAM